MFNSVAERVSPYGQSEARSRICGALITTALDAHSMGVFCLETWVFDKNWLLKHVRRLQRLPPRHGARRSTSSCAESGASPSAIIAQLQPFSGEA